MDYRNGNPKQSEQTASPEKYPQGHFKPKPCRRCKTIFSPKAPSHLYCSQECADHAHDDAYLKNIYGISKQSYKNMLKNQEHRCAICGGGGFLMDKNKHKIRLVVDHDHKTEKVRGLLCHNCNRGLGLFHDNVQHMEAAINYLKVQRLS